MAIEIQKNDTTEIPYIDNKPEIDVHGDDTPNPDKIEISEPSENY